MPSPDRRVVRVAGVGALLAVLLAVAVVALSSGGEGHRLTANVPEARYLIPGSQVRAAGQVVGEVSEAEPTRDGRARLELLIDDERVWPIPRGTKFRLRWNGTITYTGRYVAIEPPPKADVDGTLPEDGVIPSADVITRVEVDDVFNTLGRDSRRDLKGLLDEGGAAFSAADDDLRRTLDRAPPAVEQARSVLDDLGHDEEALDTLVRSGDRVVHAVRASNPGIGALIDGASTTFAATAAEADDLERTLSETAPTLASARRTLAHADVTLRAANDLTDRLAPGVAEVRGALAPLTGTLRTLEEVGPDARLTLRTLRRATPDLNPLLTRARTLMPTVESVGREGAKQVACVRPFAPEVAGLASTWSRFLLFEDDQDKYARANLPPFPFNETPQSSAEVKQAFPFLRYAFPPPPGIASGQPWFIPECGLGRETVDVTRDPEIGR